MYTKVARLALVPLVLALALFAYMNHGLRSIECKDCSTAPVRPVSVPHAPVDTATTQKAFEDIYDKGTWARKQDGTGTSGLGSTERSTVLYRTFLQQFLKDHDIHSVVDAGCGDWEFSQTIDWTGIDYKGYDIVPSVIEADIKKFGKPNIQFFAADIVTTELPPADLLISKHVLQHLPNSSVEKFLLQLPKYKHILLTNGVDRRTLTSDNMDIKPGQYRPLDVTQPPFNVDGIKVLTYEGDPKLMHQVIHIVPPR